MGTAGRAGGSIQAGASQTGDQALAAEARYTSYEALAQEIDVALLAPELSEEDVAGACDLARRYGLGSLTLRPCDVQLAADWLKGSGVVPVAAVSYPDGAATTAVKNYEVRDLLGRGARAVETPLNLGKLKSRRFQYLEMELMQLVGECRRANARVTLALDLAPLTQDLRVIASKIIKRTEVDRIRVTSAGGPLSPEDTAFLTEKLGEWTAIAAGWPIASPAEAEALAASGIKGYRTTSAAEFLDAWKAELAARKAQQPPATSPSYRADR